MSTTCTQSYSTDNNGFTSITRKGLTLPNHCAIILADLSSNYKRKETYGNGGTQEPFPLKWRMDSAYAQEKPRNPVCVCIQKEEESKESGRSLLRSSFEGREYDRGTSAREASQHHKINKASDCWQGTSKNLVAISNLPNAWKTEGKRPRDCLPIASITTETKKSIVTQGMGGNRRRCIYE